MKDLKRLIGLRIKSIREAKKLTQEMLAERMDTNPVYLSNIERGKANPTLDMIIKITEALEVEIWELFDYQHEVNFVQLREMLGNFVAELDDTKLSLTVKVLRAVAR